MTADARMFACVIQRTAEVPSEEALGLLARRRHYRSDGIVAQRRPTSAMAQKPALARNVADDPI
jgi:hypothetical protein